ncbi:ABC transporter ATP-binding protein [Rhodococcus spongiicola]|uniref:ABC-type quaternary amine transporter n=1 Tax=Rhodococcus spongiicola TaxID=2487352 RepID=A0A438B659_9NOCA|nr:ATP-binding cassette domain-containing protein [Rhodococcus spongiicola]RVW06446.1 ATP-binding cassette domain-containing protein [Rhodococcus spongiicola]
MSEHTFAGADTMIHLDQVTKQYPGQDRPAVSPLTMEIENGEFVVFVGPSGCGKTTTLRMINRLVEPTSGDIWINGQNVTHADVNELRRGIGYVIQQIGLLPHLTIADNIGLVPKLLGIPKTERRSRAADLLDLVGLDPKTYATRYPRQLSGGQQQRAGVARALAADPPIMLMDEPFGAVDPIAREKLQVEFLKLQEKIRKTIVFVTHDIDEALRLGDRIAIFDVGSRLAQFDTPLNVLTNPADDFVRDFVGAGASVRRLSLLTVGDVLAGTVDDDHSIPLHDAVQVTLKSTVHQALELVLSARADGVCVVPDLVVDGSSTEPAGSTKFIALQDLLMTASNTPGDPR